MRLIINKLLNSDLFKYGLVSLFALLLDIATLTICKELLGLSSILSATIGFSLGMIFVYIISVKYIFGRSIYSKSFEISVFILIGIVGLLINDIIIAIVSNVTSLYYAKLSAIFVVFTWNYLARRKLMKKKGLQVEQ